MKITESKFVGSFPGYEHAPRLGLPEIAIGGRSNVGKSSLINSLLNRKGLAQTSKTPGKTTLLNYYRVAGAGKAKKDFLCLVDLPGFGYAKVSQEMRKSWQKLVEEYIENSHNLRGFLLLIDSRRGLREEEIQLVEYLLYKKRLICPILTKSDKLKNTEKSAIVTETTRQLSQYGESVFFPILHSSKDGIGDSLIWRWMNERIKNES